MQHNHPDEQSSGGDATQVLGAPISDADRTIGMGSPDSAAGAEPTRMGAGIACPVCGTSNSALETYCSECGFLLGSVPGSISDDAAPVQSVFELVEDRTGRAFPLHEGDNTVGRESCDVLLMEPTVSRRHARITVTTGKVEITDTGSTNGTLVDGSPAVAGVPRIALAGSSIRFGSATFTLRGDASVQPDSDSPAAPEAPDAPVAEAADAVAWLRGVAQGGSAPTDIPIRVGTVNIGRRAGNDHIISGDPYVSGRHAAIHCDGPTVTLTDLGSTNGTMVNGMRITPDDPMLLQDGDEISIGQGKYVFEPQDSSDALVTDDAEASDLEEPAGDNGEDDSDEPVDFDTIREPQA